jgi:hypothetical protein
MKFCKGKDGVFVLDAAGSRRRVGKATDAAAPRFARGRRAVVLELSPDELAEPSRKRLGARAGDYVGESAGRLAPWTRAVLRLDTTVGWRF